MPEKQYKLHLITFAGAQGMYIRAEVMAEDTTEAVTRARAAKIVDIKMHSQLSTKMMDGTFCDRLVIECEVLDPHVLRYAVCIEPDRMALLAADEGLMPTRQKGWYDRLFERIKQYECKETMEALAKQGEPSK